MPEKRYSATEQLITIIRALDAEEEMWHRKATIAETERVVADNEAKQCGIQRYQFECMLQAIGGTVPRKIEIEHMPRDPVAVKVGHGIIAEL